MPPELKIILYVLFVICLFLVNDLEVYLVISGAIFLMLLRIPLKSLKSGFIPICLFLTFTFVSNLFFGKGKIIYSLGPLVITDEGLRSASVRAMRVFFMIAGAKILTATTDTELLIGASGKILKPLERLGIPISEFFDTMKLTMKSFAKLKVQIAETYNEKIQQEKIKGFRNRAKVISAFMIPFFVKTIQSPEQLFENDSKK